LGNENNLFELVSGKAEHQKKLLLHGKLNLGKPNTKMKAFLMKNYMQVGFTYICQVLQKSRKTL